ncbi:MAG: hypothetical protein IJK23_13265 [Clostridia bacterium]|nr:hypothetical protein [Clostridia bacterium]
MTTKKIVSVLLAVLMALSCCVSAFANDGNWQAIPTSPDGLADGDYYLDFTFDYYDWSPDVRDDRLAMWNAGEWYVDHDARTVKGSFYVPAEMSDTGEAFTQEIDPSTDLYVFVVVKVGQWQRIPTSPEGLENGEYYLDFTYDREAWSPNVRQPRLDMWNAGEWFVDHTNHMVKGTFTVPAEQSVTGQSFVMVYKPFTQDSHDIYVNALMRVGNWVKIPTSPDGLSAGDLYMDVAALASFLGTTAADLDGVDYYRDAISGDVYLTFDGYYRMYLGDDPAVLACMKEIVNTDPGTEPETPVEPEQPEDPTEPETPDEPAQQPNFWKRIVSFFLQIIDFFKKLFK